MEGVGANERSAGVGLEVGIDVGSITVAMGVDVGACEGRTVAGLNVIGCAAFTVTSEGACVGLGGRITVVGLKVALLVGAVVAFGGGGASAGSGVQEGKRVTATRECKALSCQAPLCR